MEKIKTEISETENRKSIEKNQWNQKLILWDGQLNWLTSNQTKEKKRKERESANYQYQEREG